METQELFHPGQNVAWGNRNETMKDVTKDCGPGPFKILAVEDIPEDKCSCGGSLNDKTHQARARHPFGNMGHRRVRDSVGHPQWVTLDDGTGKPLSRMLPNGEESVWRFSGVYFKAA